MMMVENGKLCGFKWWSDTVNGFSCDDTIPIGTVDFDSNHAVVVSYYIVISVNKSRKSIDIILQELLVDSVLDNWEFLNACLTVALEVPNTQLGYLPFHLSHYIRKYF